MRHLPQRSARVRLDRSVLRAQQPQAMADQKAFLLDALPGFALPPLQKTRRFHD